MRVFPTFIKLTGIAVLIAVVALGVFSSPISIRAGVPAQSTDEAPTPDATEVPTELAAETATDVATAAETLYPPCPSAEAVATEVATLDANAATMEATQPPTANPNPAYLGVRAAQVQDCGVRLKEIVENSPAAAAALQAEDVIVALNGERSTSLRWLKEQIESRSPGDKITLTVQRRGQELNIEVTLGSKPAVTPEAVETEVATEAPTEAAATEVAATMEATP